MRTIADVVVVGCGALGLSIAYCLAVEGVNVIAVDRVGPGEQTSARAAGQSVIAQTNPAMGALMHRSVNGIVGFADRSGVSLAYHQVGSLKYACSDWSAAQLEREVERASSLGARVSMVGLDRAAELAPHTDPHAAVAAWHAPDDIYFRPLDMARAFHQAAAQAGVDFQFGPEVLRMTTARGRVTGVQTSLGKVQAGVVVIAAGNWSASLLSTAGVDGLPVLFLRHQYTIRSGIPGIDPQLPSVRVVDHAVYTRPEGTGLMFGTYEPHPLVFDSAALPPRTENVPLDPRPVHEALDQVRSLFPTLAGSRIAEIRGGVVSMTPDGSYLIDRASGVDGLYFLTGCNVMGLSVAPAVGEDMAAWITSGSRPDSLAGFGLARFGVGALSPAEMRERCLREYEGIYRDSRSVGHVRTYGHRPSPPPARGASS